MPKKGSRKGAGAKGSGMTEEDRVLLLQQRAEAEKEMAKRKEEMLTQFLKDKLQKEEKNTAVNLHKLTQQWRTVLRQTRGTELRREIEIIRQTFERVLDRKDSVMKSLVGDLNEAEQQFGQALRSHLHCVDRLPALQTSRLTFFQQQWQNNLQELGAEFSTEREHISSLHQHECTHLENVTFAMEQCRSEVDTETRQNYESNRDELKTKQIGEKHALEVHMERVLQQVHEGLPAGDDQHIALNTLLIKDQRRAYELDKQMKKLQKIHESISALRLKPNSSQKESETAAQELRATKEALTQRTRQLKTQLGQACALDRKRLTTLTVQSSTATKQLQGFVSKGEKILRCAEMCRKFESEHEKVLPFYASSLTAEEQTQDKLKATEPPSEDLAGALLDYADLAGFWQRYNKVLLERLCFEKEKDVLTRENQQLRALLRQYMDSISVSNEVLCRQNALLMVSQPTFTDGAERQRRQHHTVIEAAHVIQHTL
ncbi:hypothetical protein CRUP_004946 [Coryphaenoides rupestris]|nr:hypothetical protein CRUP_004946 [Coryphaenoides rupestris]